MSRSDIVRLDRKAMWCIMMCRGFGRNSLARTMSKDPTEIGKWVNGKRGISLDTAEDMADILECTVRQMTGEEPFIPEVEAITDPLSDALSSGSDTTKTPGPVGIIGIIKIDEDMPDEARKAEITEIINRLVGLRGEARLILGKPREGCVELTMRLTREQWQQLERAVRQTGPDYLHGGVVHGGVHRHLIVTMIELFPRVDAEEYDEYDEDDPMEKRQVSPEELKEILRLSGMWVRHEKGGSPAKLRGAEPVRSICAVPS